jgi:amidase
MSRRMSGWIVAATLLLPLGLSAESPGSDSSAAKHFRFREATVAELQAAMASGNLTSEELTRAYIRRIFELDQGGPGVNAVIELNPDALVMAQQADALRRKGHVLGPLHGIPVLLKANIDTGAEGLHRGRESAGRRRRHPGKDQPFGMGEFPLQLLDQRLVRRGRADP